MIEATRPTWTPRILTLALVSITRPDRSEVRVTGTNDLKVPANNAYVSQIAAISNTNRKASTTPGADPRLFASATALSSQVEVAGLPVDGKRDHHHHERRDDQRGTHRTSDRLPDPGRPTGAV